MPLRVLAEYYRLASFIKNMPNFLMICISFNFLNPFNARVEQNYAKLSETSFKQYFELSNSLSSILL